MLINLYPAERCSCTTRALTCPHKKRHLPGRIITINHSTDFYIIEKQLQLGTIHNHRDCISRSRRIESRAVAWPVKKDRLWVVLRIYILFCNIKGTIAVEINPIIVIQVTITTYVTTGAIVPINLVDCK